MHYKNSNAVPTQSRKFILDISLALMLPEMSIIMTLFRPQSSIVLWCFYSGLEFFGNAYSQNYLSLQM